MDGIKNKKKEKDKQENRRMYENKKRDGKEIKCDYKEERKGGIESGREKVRGRESKWQGKEVRDGCVRLSNVEPESQGGERNDKNKKGETLPCKQH